MTDITQADQKRYAETVRRAACVVVALHRVRIIQRGSQGSPSLEQIRELTTLWTSINDTVDSLGPAVIEQLERMAR